MDSGILEEIYSIIILAIKISYTFDLTAKKEKKKRNERFLSSILK